MNILKNAEKKIAKFNSGISSNVKFYHDVLNARGENKSLVDEAGNVSDGFLEIIEVALRGYFRMNVFGKQMGSKEEFLKKLKKKLESHKTKMILARLRDVSIISPNLESCMADAENLYESLSNREDGLSANNTYFCVGTTKVMHCLFPELFVMLDRNVGRAVLGYSPGQYNNFIAYWEVMKICQDELIECQKSYGNINSLLKLDSKPTTMTRIFDKCASTMGK